MKTEPKIFHARINLVSDKLEKLLKSHHYNLNSYEQEQKQFCGCIIADS